jgi:hypothetical protein
MMARKKRHFFIANLVKFWKFNEYLVVDRPLGMIHIYTRSDENQPRWVYIRKKDLEKLYNDYRKKKLRNYKKYSSFHGTFPDVLDEKKSYNILDSFNLEAYEAEKDRAILDIGKKAPVRGLSDLRLLRARIANIKLPITTQKDLAIGLGLDRRTIYEWKSAKDMDTAEGNAVREAELLK